MRIGTKILASFGLVLAFLLVVGAVVFRATAVVEYRFSEVVEDNLAASAALADVLVEVTRIVVEAERWLLLDNPEAKREFDGATEDLADVFDAYEAVIERASQAQRTGMASEMSARLSELRVHSNALVTAGREALAVDPFVLEPEQRRNFLLRLWVPHYAALEVAKLGIAAEMQEFQSHQDHVFDSIEHLRLITVIALVSSLLSAGMLGWFVSHRLIARPLRRLGAAAASIASGNTAQRVVVDSSDEFGQLEVAFNDMAGEIGRRQQQILEEKEYSEGIIASMVDFIVVTDPSGKILTVNAAACELFAADREELIGSDLASLVGEGAGAAAFPLLDGFAEDLPADGVLRGHQTILGRVDGEEIPVVVNVSLMHDRAGDVSAVVLVGRDMRERHRLESTLERAQHFESVGRLAGGVAHDFNNLLTVITGAAGFLAESNLDAECREDVAAIENAADRGAELIRQLLAFSRRQILKPEVVVLNDVVTNISRMVRRLIGDDIDVVMSLDHEAGSISADPGQIEQVILNLATNSRDAMPSGGTLSIETSAVNLDDEAARLRGGVELGRYAVLRIRDTGHGMNPETMSHVFEPFYTTKGVGTGTGLGLSSAHGVVTQSGGHFTLESEPGRGTEFGIFLPSVEAPPVDSAAPAQPSDHD